MKNRIAKWYKQGLWTTEMVQSAVGKTFGGTRFTAEDFKKITGKENA